MLKQFLFLLGFLALGFAAFIAVMGFAFSGYDYPFFLPAVVVFVYIWLWILFSLPQRNKKKELYSALAILAVSLLGYGGYIVKVEYERSIPTVTEFSTHNYSPFSEDSKAATLDGASTLQLSRDSLPRLDGSTALYPMYAAFAKATYPKLDIADSMELIAVSKTGQAYERLLAGEVDIIFAPAPSKFHLHKAEQSGLKLNLIPIAKEAFVFFVNSENPIENLTVEQIKQIYSGHITNWRQVGGKSEAIRAFQRPENSGSQTVLQRIMADTPLMDPVREDVNGGMSGIINQVAHYRNFDNALGFSFLLYSTEMVKNNQIKLLSINGILPNQTNIRNKSYPFTHDIYAVTLGNENQTTLQLIDWIKSSQGKELISKTGYVPE
ncbi:phosphate transport system substrate-binding protein [Pasteurella testudinis DSM 23072]|uniref:Phosphate transport system substrate-binding protein n=1 Tax=Pasteurella testudinis DSM 23072 TaxID=1122938 RepID=A0A1W1UZH7_9PAST|nr:substrate-binding domain-containing protein [Pasteurella testudinis]SMB86522.1 phosphate transport system substrate-binding protein [Pasteurella testudinis DSM 23072]SUB51813.1 Phosphate-binding protein pstS precursor [Pasteurella testudinis]